MDPDASSGPLPHALVILRQRDELARADPASCNIVCDACFATNDPKSEKPLEVVEDELRRDALRLRRSDGIFIAGGEPLTHPGVVEIVRMVAGQGATSPFSSRTGWV